MPEGKILQEFPPRFRRCLSQNVSYGGVHDRASGLELLARRARLCVEDFLGFLHQSAFAKLSIILVRFASAILESLSFPVYVYEWVGVLMIFHDVLPLTRILLFGASIHAAPFPATLCVRLRTFDPRFSAARVRKFNCDAFWTPGSCRARVERIAVPCSTQGEDSARETANAAG